jgi:hypothetical protein
MRAHLTQQIADTSSASAVWGSRRRLAAVSAPSFLECVGTVAREHRERAEADLLDIAYWSGASQGTVSRFERAEAQTRDLDSLLGAYAKVSDISPGDLLREATERWEDGGGAVVPEIRPRPIRPPGQAAQAAGQVARRARRTRGSRREDPGDQGREQA